MRPSKLTWPIKITDIRILEVVVDRFKLELSVNCSSKHRQLRADGVFLLCF